MKPESPDLIKLREINEREETMGTKNLTFREWIREQYDNEELETIRDHGCVSGCASGLIYYSETLAIYEQYGEELHEIVADWVMDCGCEYPRSIIENFQSITQFKNAVVWTATEIVADEILNILELA